MYPDCSLSSVTFFTPGETNLDCLLQKVEWSSECVEEWHGAEVPSRALVARIFPEPTRDFKHRDALAA